MDLFKALSKLTTTLIAEQRARKALRKAIKGAKVPPTRAQLSAAHASISLYPEHYSSGTWQYDNEVLTFIPTDREKLRTAY